MDGWMDRSQPSLGGCQYQKPTPHHHTPFGPREEHQRRVNLGQLTIVRHVKGIAWPFHAAAAAVWEIFESRMGVSDSSFLEVP
jgi:hypothetical protein